MKETSFNYNKYSMMVIYVALSFTSAVSIDCPDLFNFAFELGIQTLQPAIWIELQGDCCNASGITCDIQRVTQISWNTMNLNGSINGTALPSDLLSLTLYNNRITGKIPALPIGLSLLSLFGNQLSDDLPLFPSSLIILELGQSGYPGNHFTGTLILNRPRILRINDNWITNVVIQDGSGLITCDLSDNPLLGNPGIAGLSGCTMDGLYSANSLPKTMTNSKTAFTKVSTSLGNFKIASGFNYKLNTASAAVYTTTAARISKHVFRHLIHRLTILELVVILIRVFVCAVILVFVTYKTPWKREWKNKLKRREESTNPKKNLLLSVNIQS